MKLNLLGLCLWIVLRSNTYSANDMITDPKLSIHDETLKLYYAGRARIDAESATGSKPLPLTNSQASSAQRNYGLLADIRFVRAFINTEERRLKLATDLRVRASCRHFLRKLKVSFLDEYDNLNESDRKTVRSFIDGIDVFLAQYAKE